MHAFLSNLANRQTDRHGQKHVPPPLSEVINEFTIWNELIAKIQKMITKNVDNFLDFSDAAGVHETSKTHTYFFQPTVHDNAMYDDDVDDIIINVKKWI